MGRYLMLPGMDGVLQLDGELSRCLPDVDCVSYDSRRPQGYDELEALVRERLVGSEPVTVVAESFSGPIAMRLAANPPPSLKAVVLVATFVRSPVPRWLLCQQYFDWTRECRPWLAK